MAHDNKGIENFDYDEANDELVASKDLVPNDDTKNLGKDSTQIFDNIWGKVLRDENEDSINVSEVISNNHAPNMVGTLKSGATQELAGAVAGELWRTSGHATLLDNIVMIGV